MAGSTFKTIGNIGAASGAALAVGVRDTVDGADDLRREVRVERDRRADRSTSNPQLNALIAPTAAAKDLIGLAGRMGNSDRRCCPLRSEASVRPTPVGGRGGRAGKR
jgi:hypothetical protein